MQKFTSLSMRAAAVLSAVSFVALSSGATEQTGWMASLPGQAYVAALSIPGSHDTATAAFESESSKTYSQTQEKTIEEQMQMGVRAFDLRPGVKDGRLKLYHGSTATTRYMDEVLQSMCGFLEAHPSEFFIIHLYKASNSNKNIGELMDALLASDEVRDHVASYAPRMTVDDIRGRILFLKRSDLDWNNPCIGYFNDWDEHGHRQNDRTYISSDVYPSVSMALQDYANPKKGAVTDKVDEITELLAYTGSLSTFETRYGMRWVMNFASGYDDNLISHNTGYANVAQSTNKAIVDFLADEANSGPTGIIMADWVGCEDVIIGGNSYTTYGEQLVDAVIAQNNRYISDERYWAMPNDNPSWSLVDMSALEVKDTFRGNVEWADVNSDGNMDLLFKGRNMGHGWATEFRALLNDGSSLSELQALDDYDGTGWCRVLLPYDFNADGHIDLLHAASWDTKLGMNDAGNPGSFTRNEGYSLYGNDISLGDDDIERRSQGLAVTADFDMDGYPDLVTYCRPGDNRPYSVPFLSYNHDGRATYDRWETGLPALRDGAMAVGDYNRDGRPDLLVSGIDNDGNRRIAIVVNKSTGKFDFRFECIYPESLQNYATDMGIVGFVDFDNDGNLDIFVTGRTSSADYSAALLLNRGNDEFEDANLPIAPVRHSGMDLCDLNGDGLIDIIYAGECSRLGQFTTVIYNMGEGKCTVDDFSFRGHRSGASVRAFDYAANGRPMLAAMGYGDQCFEMYQQQGDHAATSFSAQETVDFRTSADENGNFTISWDAEPGMRYNYVVKANDGHIITAVPCNPDLGIQLQSNCDAATTAGSVTLSIPASDVESWGVYAIGADNRPATRIYTTNDPFTGIGDVEAENLDAPVEYYNLQGIRVASPAGGIFIERRGNTTAKRYIP